MIQRRWRTTLSRHRLPLLLAGLVCSATFVAAPVLADRISSTVKTANPPPDKPITEYLAGEIPNLMSSDPATQKLARDSIVFECAGHAGLSASPEYGTLYATLLAKALQPAAASPSIRIRVNAAVVVDHVAFDVYREGGSASGLEQLVEKLLKDHDEAVVLWGIKAARLVIASQLLDGKNPSALDKSVVQAVKDFPNSGSIVEDAYIALTPRDDAQQDALPKRPGGQTIPATAAVQVLPELLELIAWRGDQYKAGGSPPSPMADRPATVFIPVKLFSNIQGNPALMNQTLKTLGDATCSMLRYVQNGTPTPELIQMLNAFGDAFVDFGQLMTNSSIEKSGSAIAKLSQNTDPNRMGKLCDDLTDALRSAGVADGNAPGVPAVAGNAR